MYSTDPANLFSELYDELPERLFAEEEDAETWLDDPSVGDIAADIEHEAVATGRISAETVERLLDVIDVDRNRFAILLGLDRAFLQSGIVTGSPDASGLLEITLRYLETGALSTEPAAGWLLPKIASPSQEHLLPQSLRDAFAAVVRVPKESPVAVVHATLNDWPARTRREAGLYIAGLPAFDASAPLAVRRVDGHPPAYAIRLEEPEPGAWVRERLAVLDASRTIVALLPEMSLTPALLDAWQQACRDTARPAGSQLGWIVVGSGPEHDRVDERPHNRAVVLERTTGTIAWAQDKQYRFQLDDDMIRPCPAASPSSPASSTGSNWTMT